MGRSAATAFVPGHVTGFFSPEWRDDPARSGSVGAGITLTDGVTVTVEPDDPSRVTYNGEPVTMEAVDLVLDELDRSAAVSVESPLPIGTGFGVSGAVALGTALACNRGFGGTRTENQLIGIAHRAEVEAGTGLGDVVAQARGGVPIRLAPGAPPHGSLDGIPATTPVQYVTFGELDTPSVIRGDTDAIRSAGEAALETLLDRPTLSTLAEASRRFSREAALITPEVAEAVAAVSAAGGEAFMAMLGATVVSIGSGLTDAGYEAARCSVHPAGATVRE